MIVFFFAGGIFAYVQLLTRSLQSNQSPPPNAQKSPTTGYFPRNQRLLLPLDLTYPSAATLPPTPTPQPAETPATPTSAIISETPTATPQLTTPSPTPGLETPSPSPSTSSSPKAPVDQEVEPLPSVTKNPEEEERVRKEVLARIDLLKELTAKEKDYLYAQVERARGFTKLAIIPFVRGRTKPEQYQIDHMLSYLEKPEFKKLFEDPTVVLVVAAYADKQGSDEQNLQISKERGTNLMKILQNQGRRHQHGPRGWHGRTGLLR